MLVLSSPSTACGQREIVLNSVFYYEPVAVTILYAVYMMMMIVIIVVAPRSPSLGLESHCTKTENKQIASAPKMDIV